MPAQRVPSPEIQGRLLRSGLLDVTELPAGYVADPLENCESAALVSSTSCDRSSAKKEQASGLGRSIAKVATVFEGHGKRIVEWLLVFIDGKAATLKEVVAQQPGAAYDCSSVTNDGRTIVSNYVPIPGEPFGQGVAVFWFTEHYENQLGTTYVLVQFPVADAVVSLQLSDRSTLARTPFSAPELSAETIEMLSPLVESARAKAQAIQSAFE
jgi:hypothetical protein